MKKLWDDVVQMLKTPFVGNLDLIHLFALVGVVLIFGAIWALIMEHVRTFSSKVASEV